jgi:hypothetical protein
MEKRKALEAFTAEIHQQASGQARRALRNANKCTLVATRASVPARHARPREASGEAVADAALNSELAS